MTSTSSPSSPGSTMAVLHSSTSFDNICYLKKFWRTISHAGFLLCKCASPLGSRSRRLPSSRFSRGARCRILENSIGTLLALPTQCPHNRGYRGRGPLGVSFDTGAAEEEAGSQSPVPHTALQTYLDSRLKPGSLEVTTCFFNKCSGLLRQRSLTRV